MCADIYIGSADGRNAYSDLNVKEAQQLWHAFEVFLAGFMGDTSGEPLKLMEISTEKKEKLISPIELGASEFTLIRQVCISIQHDLRFPVETQAQTEQILSDSPLRFPALFVARETQRNQSPREIAVFIESLTRLNETSVFLV